jgi:hypothetical protein
MSQKSFDESNASSSKLKHIQSKFWKCNYHIKTEESFKGKFEEIESVFRPLCEKYTFGEEYGESKETPHIEGYMVFKKKTEFNSIQKLFKWSDLRKSSKKNVEAGFEYCMKEGNEIRSLGLPKPLETIQNLRPYQEDIVNIIRGEPEARRIYWFYGEKNIGKSELLFKLCAEYKACILPVTKRHALSQVYKTKDGVDIYVLNLTADESAYQTNEMFSILESIKDRMFSAAFGTDTNGMCLFNHKHLIVMANDRPDFVKTCIDENRFDIRYIDNENYEFKENP